MLRVEREKERRKKRKKERGLIMSIDLYYQENNWKQRGEGKNVHLIVYYNLKKFRYLTNTKAEGMISNSVQLLRKGDIEEYVKALEGEGFSRID